MPHAGRTQGTRMRKKMMCAACLAVFGQANADTELTFNTEWQHRTNINRSADAPVDDDVWTIGGALVADEQARNGSLQLRYLAQRENFLNDTNPDRTRLDGEAEINLYTRTRALGWYGASRTSETVLDLLAADLPDNSNRVSTYRTGLTSRWRTSPRDSVDVRAGKIWVETENGQADSESDQAIVRWTHGMSARSQTGVQGVYSNTVPESPVIGEFGTQKAAIFWQYQLKSGGTAYFQVGAADTDAKEPDGGQVGYVAEYQIQVDSRSGKREWLLDAGRELAGSGLGERGGENTVRRQSGEEFRLDVRDYARIAYRYQLLPRRLSLGLTGERATETSQFSTRDTATQQYGFDLGWQFRFGGELSVSVDSVTRKQGRDSALTEQDEVQYEIEYRQDFLRRFQFNCGYEVRRFDDDVELTLVGCGIDYAVY